MKPIVFSAHARNYLSERGFETAQVEEAIRTSTWKDAERGRYQCRRRFPYVTDWKGKRYRFIEVRPIFVENEQEIKVVTVYTYFY